MDEEERAEGNIVPEPPAEPDLDGNFDNSRSPYISNELPTDNWPPRNVTYMDYYNEQNIPDPQGLSSSGYDYSDYVTHENLSSLLAEQRAYFDIRLDEQIFYIDSTRDELLLRLDQLQPNNDVIELQQYIDRKFESFQSEQSSYFGGLRDEFQTSFVQIQRMFERMKVDKSGGGGGGGDEIECQVTDGGGASADDDVFIPILCDIDKKIESDFAIWIHRAKTRDVIRLHGGYTLIKEKLLNLGNPDFPLECEDMDTALMLIRARSRNFEDIFSDKYAVLYSAFGLLMIHVRIKSLDPRGQFLQHAASASSSLDNNVMRYVNGYILKNFGKKWKDCNYLLWSHLVDNKYWVLFHVDLKSWKFTLIDNYQKSADDASIYISVLPILKVLLDVIQKYVPELDTNKNEHLEYWRKPISDVPQLERYSDSGIFVIKYVECLLAGITLDAVRVDKIPIYRYKMMLDFFHKELFFILYERNVEQS